MLDYISDFAEGTVNVLGHVVEVGAPVIGATAAVAGGIALAPFTGGASTIAGVAAATAITAGATYAADEIGGAMQDVDFDGDGPLSEPSYVKSAKSVGREASNTYARSFASGNTHADAWEDVTYDIPSFPSLTGGSLVQQAGSNRARRFNAQARPHDYKIRYSTWFTPTMLKAIAAARYVPPKPARTHHYASERKRARSSLVLRDAIGVPWFGSVPLNHYNPSLMRSDYDTVRTYR